MTQQGCCSEPARDTGNILDRLEGLRKIISPETIEQALLETDRGKQRACRLSHRVMVWLVLAMGVLTHLPIRQVFKHARRMRLGEKTPSRSNLCEARQRLGAEPLRRVFDLVVRPLATPQTPGAFYKGLRPMGIDGTVMDAPDTPANAERFGRSSGGRGDGAFPQVRKVSLVELGTHVEVALAVGGWQDSEQKLVVQLFDRIPADALLLEDRGFFSYDHWKMLDGQGVKLLVRMKSNVILRPFQRLPDGSYLAKIYPSSYHRDKDRDGIVVRVIEYTLDDPQRTGHGEQHRLLTNLFDHEMFPARELACKYHERWEEELVFDEQKTHLDPRRPGKAAHFRSQTPQGVEQELYALSLGHFVVRALMLEAAKEANLDVDRLSFTGCLRILQARLPECDSSTPVGLDEWFHLLQQELADEWIEPRRNRVNPRVVKRKMSKFAKKRPKHRSQPPSQKTFAETVVIT
jgi:Insertion element 4 transposase N-terminal/Transposase DDE domain